MTIYQGTILYYIISDILTRNQVSHTGKDLNTLVNLLQKTFPHNEVCEIMTKSYEVVGFNV